MLAIGRSIDRLSFLTETAREALRRRLRELTGIGLIVLALLLTAALGTWSVQDPSLSHATNAPVRNVLGVGGAIVADLLMQLFGLATIALVLAAAIWGWRLASHRRLSRERMRVALWALGVPLWAACAATWPRSAAWPLPGGLGGVIGDWMLELPALVAGGTLTGLPRSITMVATGIAAVVCFALVAGVGLHASAEASDDEDDEPHTSVSLGWIAHGLLSLKARAQRMF